VYVSDDDKNSIQKFTSDGKFITSWGSEGTGDGQFLRPEDVAIDSSDNVYVVDSRNVHEKKDVCALFFHLLMSCVKDNLVLILIIQDKKPFHLGAHHKI